MPKNGILILSQRLSTNTYFLSFETLGFAMPVEILTDTTTNYLLKISIVGTGEVYGYGINCGSNCSEVLKAGTYIELTGNIPLTDGMAAIAAQRQPAT